jgi:hypothetical protein
MLPLRPRLDSMLLRRRRRRAEALRDAAPCRRLLAGVAAAQELQRELPDAAGFFLCSLSSVFAIVCSALVVDG